MSLRELFRKDPIRELEEVQKVTAKERLETDVEEFEETESAREVLTRLGEVIETHPANDPRFLYVEATFGSGKTHLLKLTGLVVDDEAEFAHLGNRLASKWPGFDNLQQSVEASHVDRFKPVFLNLLDRDASKEPPLPFLIFEGIGRELDYPTDPNWLLEWVWQLDMEYDGVWEELQETAYGLDDVACDGETFDDILAEKAYLRTWLYEAVPSLTATTGTDLDTEAGVKASIEAAEDEVAPSEFDAAELVERVEMVTEALNERGGRTELMLGLDEVALFVGDSTERYREFENTMEALQHGPNPVVVTTGQYSLPETRDKLIGSPPETHWTHRQVPLEGADTEIIVRRRWLDKSESGGDRVASLLESMPDLSLHTYREVGSANPDPVESYPFREYDLTLLRTVMQELITQGRETDRDYIQGRALLVLVRSLFTTFGWAERDEASLVTWDVLFDLLTAETPYIPLWVQELLRNTLVPTFGGNGDAREVRVAKALYLLNQTPKVPSTPENLARLRLGDATESLETVVEETADALETLVDKRLVLTETTDEGDEVYTLVSEEQESILRRAQEAAEQVSPHQLSAWVETRLTENDRFFRSDESRHEIDLGTERLVPLRYRYSVLDPVDRAPPREHDALCVRVLANEPQKVAEGIETWQEVNNGRDGGEHILITLEAPETMLQRVREVIGMGNVLDEETESHEELEREQRTNKRQLESSVAAVLENAEVYTVTDHEGPRSSVIEDVVRGQLQAEFGQTRKTLSQPLLPREDATAMASFFRGSGDWPLDPADAVLFGVDTAERVIESGGWAREFIDEYESKQAVDVAAILQQTRTANGRYRGTPRESIAALLITLATSNAQIALKQDTEFLSDPVDIGTAVETKGGLTALQIRFDVDPPNLKKVRELVTVVCGTDPGGEDADDWMAELGAWVAAHSVTVKRTLKGLDREFDVALETFEGVVQPALRGETLSTADLDGSEEIERAIDEAETFVDGRALFTADDGEQSLWERFAEMLALLESRYPGDAVTERMRATANGERVPSVETVQTRLEDAEAYRVDELSAQYRRVVGDEPSASTPDEIRAELTDWLQRNEATVRAVLDSADDVFDGAMLEDLRAVFEAAWGGETPDEASLVDASVTGQAETYETCRTLFDGDGTGLWSRVTAEHERLQRDHPDSPTTASLEYVLGASTPPRVARVRDLLEEAADPLDPRPGDEDWEELKRVAEALQQELPNADITDEVVGATSGSERPTEARTRELLDEANVVLERARTVRERLDSLDDGSVVRIDGST
jgi:hypothetical protein